MTTITLTHEGKTYTAEDERGGWHPCAGCTFFAGPVKCDLPCEHPDKSVCSREDIIWIEQPQQESPLDMPGFKAQKAYNGCDGCCGQPNTCEQPCFHASGRTTPGQPGGIASVPQSLEEVRYAADVRSDGWVKWGGGVMPVTGMVEVRYRNGATNTDDADSFLWDHSDCPDDIVAYRKARSIPVTNYKPDDVAFEAVGVSLSELIDDYTEQMMAMHGSDSAGAFLGEANATMMQRGKQYDSEGGERSFAAAAAAFNAIKGKDLTAADIALVQVCIKLVRSEIRKAPHRDSLLDGVAYMSLYSEERMRADK